MPSFLQTAPVQSNRFLTDRALRLTLERLLPPEIFAQAAPAFTRLGERARAELPALAAQAEANPPTHLPYDSWGKRIDRIDVDPAFTRLVEIGAEEGLVACAYDAGLGQYGRVVQVGLAHLYDPVSAVATCPLVMTDGAATVLRQLDPALAARYLPRLTARHHAITSGQWMTETAGGSDVSRTETTAAPLENGQFALTGTKFFTSATSADIALALARTPDSAPGSAGLSLFLLELKNPDGSWNGITVRRMKDKMGTKALPTAELELNGTIAVPVAGLGRGVAKIARLLNIARLWAGLAAPAGVGHFLDLARDYAQKREVFGRPLAQTPSHTAWIAGLTAEYEAMLALNFETARAIGETEHGTETLSRLLAPLNKLACARDGIDVASQLLESFGGAGYMEDTGIPRVFRNLHVHTIWEGTTNVLAHDVVRALRDRALGEAFIEDIKKRMRDLKSPEATTAGRIDAALTTLAPHILAPSEDDARFLGQGMARLFEASLLAQSGEWRAATYQDNSGLIAADLFTRKPLLPVSGVDLELDQLAYGLPNL